MFEDFKIKKSKIAPKEQKLLAENGYRWCPKCKKALEVCNFHKGQGYCVPCNDISRDEYFLRYPTKKKEIMDKSVEKHKEKRRAYAREYANIHKEKRNFLSLERTRLHPEYKRNYERKRREDPLYRVKCRISSHVRRIGVIGKNGRSLKFIGVVNLQDFCDKLAKKCGNPNWFKSSEYHIDHIWQVNWFVITEENWQEVCYLVNNHSNLRPLKISENLTRKDLDFSPLKKEDFPKYESYLKPEIREKIKDYFNNV